MWATWKHLQARRGRVEDHCCIDASVLLQDRQARTGHFQRVVLVEGHQHRGCGVVVVTTHAIEICGYVATGAAVEPVQEVMQITRVPARFANRPCGRGRGATSTFLLCPGCQSRRRKLYIVGPQCRCRDATGWASPSKPRAPPTAVYTRPQRHGRSLELRQELRVQCRSGLSLR